MVFPTSSFNVRELAPEGSADHHKAAVHAGEQAGTHRCAGTTGGGPDAGPQVSAKPDRKPHNQSLHGTVRHSQLSG